MNSVATTLSGQHLIVTGTTGFLGSVWLSLVLRHAPDIARLTLLVRGKASLDATARMAERFDTCPVYRPLHEIHGDALAAFLDARVEILDADITRPDLGLSADVLDELAASADAIVHIAGLTDFHPDPARGVPANVDGAVHMGRLAQRLPRARMLHVSTAFVAGRADGETPEALVRGRSPAGVAFDPEATHETLQRLIEEEPDKEARRDRAGELAERLGWPNNYTFTKGLAEHLLAGMDLDLTIVRPSVVECSRTFPFPGWNEGLNTSGPITWFCGSAFRALPTTGHHVFDIVPVDAVARWTTIALADLLEGRHAPVLHLASGDVNPASFSRIVELTALARRRHGRHPQDDALWDRIAKHIDVVPRTHDEQPFITPDRLERWAGRVDDGLRNTLSRDHLPSILRDPLRRMRRNVTRSRRDLGRLRRMLDVYRPFIHDHSWVFATDVLRRSVAARPLDDPFRDEVETLCWRHYWIDVQYPGIVKWAFPILRGDAVPCDPPSHPPLALGTHAPDTLHTPAARGVA